MKPQTIVTANGERLVVLTEADYDALVEAAEYAADVLAFEDFNRKLAAGEEEFIPSTIVDRLLDSDESRITIWRDCRGLALQALADAAGIEASLLSRIEAREQKGSADVLRKIAAVLKVEVDDLADRSSPT